MKDILINVLKKYKYIILLFIVELILFFTNYKSGSYLVGWDNLFPEFNLQANIKRNLFSVWQEYRGLGTLDGMSYAANLFHSLLAGFFTAIFPSNLVRYLIIFLLHFSGGIGMYFLSLKLLDYPHEYLKRIKNREIIAVTAALFYQYNISTIQMFYAPFEQFAYQYALFPSALFLIISYLESGKNRMLSGFVLLCLFLSPQAHVPTLFIVYILFMFLFVFTYFILARNLIVLKRITVLFLITLTVNSFWLFPYFYSSLSKSQTIVNSKINKMTTENVFLRNKTYGNIQNVPIMKGFSFDYVDYQSDGSNYYMMNQWRNHFRNPMVIIVSWLFFLMAFLGAIVIARKKLRILYPVVLIFVLSFCMLGNDIPVISLVYYFFTKNIPFFFEIFRFTFTKFSIIYSFSYSLLLALGFYYIINKSKEYKEIITIGTISVFIFYISPVFSGGFLYYNLRNKIPIEYFDLFAYLKNQDKNQRIAILPQPTYWGWLYNRWGARGSGFIWWGIEQATMDGAFYPWSRENENYYWELSRSVYSSDLGQFLKVINKYSINMVLVDDSILSPFSPRALYLETINDFVKSNNFQEVFKDGKLRLYKYINPNSADKYISLTGNVINISPEYRWGDKDDGYNKGLYITRSQSVSDLYIPYRTFFTNRLDNENLIGINESKEYYFLIKEIDTGSTGYKLEIPQLSQQDFISSEVPGTNEEKVIAPQLYLNGRLVDNLISNEYQISSNALQIPLKKGINTIEVRIPKLPDFFDLDTQISGSYSKILPRNCDQFSDGVYLNHLIDQGQDKKIRLISINSSNCFEIDLNNLFQDNSYLISIDNKNIQGKGLLFSVINKFTQRADIDVYLTDKQNKRYYFIIPPMERYGAGYALHFDNISIGREKTENELGRVVVSRFPYRFMSGIRIIREGAENIIPNNLTNYINVSHPNPSLYEVSVDKRISPVTANSMNTILSLHQSFDKGWKAYVVDCSNGGIACRFKKFLPFFFFEEIKTHVLVSNWANGWDLKGISIDSDDKDQNIVIVYWPQYLQYLGFGLLGTTLVSVLIITVKNKNKN